MLLPVLLVAGGMLASCAGDPPTAPRPAPPAPPTIVDSTVVATLAPGADPAAIAGTFGTTVADWEADERCAAFRVPSGQTRLQFSAALLADARIVTCEENGWLEPAETRQQSFAFDDGAGTHTTYVEQPAAAAIGLAAAHAVSTGSGVIVAVLDTGLDGTHPELSGRLVAGWDFVANDASPAEQPNGLDDDGDGRIDEAFGHGTHTAGIVALVAPGASIMPVRVLDADGRGDVLAVAAGVRFALAHGARVINLSLGTLKSSDAIQNAIEEAEKSGVVVIASAGNWGAATPEEYPARSSHASAIAAVDASARPAPFTSFADFVALSAPGVGIRSAFAGGGYRLWSGTSMSAPFVSGTSALLLERHPAWHMREVMDRLGATAHAIVNATPAQQGRLGAGALHAGDALAPDAP